MGYKSSGGLFARPLKTKQTTVYTAGDDGTYLTGITGPNPRFALMAENIILDNATGLMWPKNLGKVWASALNPTAAVPDSSGTGSWADSVNYVRGNLIWCAADSKNYVCEAANGPGTAVKDPNGGANPNYWTEMYFTNTTADKVTLSYWHLFMRTSSWTAAIPLIEGLTFGGYTDWRMPSINELLQIGVYSNSDIGGIWKDANSTHGDGGPGFTDFNAQNGLWANNTHPADAAVAAVFRAVNSAGTVAHTGCPIITYMAKSVSNGPYAMFCRGPVF